MSHVCMACWGTSKITGADPICERDEMGASNLKTPNLLVISPLKNKRIPKFWMGLETKKRKAGKCLWYFYTPLPINPSIVETEGKLVKKKISRGKPQAKNQGWNPGITFYSFYYKVKTIPVMPSMYQKVNQSSLLYKTLKGLTKLSHRLSTFWICTDNTRRSCQAEKQHADRQGQLKIVTHLFWTLVFNLNNFKVCGFPMLAGYFPSPHILNLFRFPSHISRLCKISLS